MELLEKKLKYLAAEDRVTVDAFLTFAQAVYKEVVSHAPCGRFQVLLPKTGYRHPFAVCVDTPYEQGRGIELVYQLRDCVPGERAVTIYDCDGANPQTLVIHCNP